MSKDHIFEALQNVVTESARNAASDHIICLEDLTNDMSMNYIAFWLQLVASLTGKCVKSVSLVQPNPSKPRLVQIVIESEPK